MYMEQQIISFHNPDEPYGFLSNWAKSRFSLNGMIFISMEQYMMYSKAMLFHDSEIADQIMEAEDPGLIKALGRKVHNYDDIIWNGMRQILIYQGLLAKFSQNEDLNKALLETGEAILAECAVHDKIWGIGLSMKDPARLDIQKWKGQNLLGFALMAVREQLR